MPRVGEKIPCTTCGQVHDPDRDHRVIEAWTGNMARPYCGQCGQIPISLVVKVKVRGDVYVLRGRTWVHEQQPQYKTSVDAMKRWQEDGRVQQCQE